MIVKSTVDEDWLFLIFGGIEEILPSVCWSCLKDLLKDSLRELFG